MSFKEGKMKKARWELLLLCVLIGPLCSGHQNNTKEYKNAELGISFSYPDTWILNADSVEKTRLISLFSSEALETKETTMDLVKGVKVEIYFLQGEVEETSQQKQCGLLTKQSKRLRQYCQEADSCFIIITREKINGQLYSFLAYIPEKEKRKEYWATYNAIILSFAFTKSGSK